MILITATPYPNPGIPHQFPELCCAEYVALERSELGGTRLRLRRCVGRAEILLAERFGEAGLVICHDVYVYQRRGLRDCHTITCQYSTPIAITRWRAATAVRRWRRGRRPSRRRHAGGCSDAKSADRRRKAACFHLSIPLALAA